MRVGLVCPYSLTVPGGVQSQVLGLGRMLRSLGVEARVLGPCDGPPPDAGVTPLGNSVPASGNGSVASIAPDPAATLRTIRALREEAFDVVHIHEPVVPGPCLTALVFCDSPMVGTFHRAGQSGWSRAMRPFARLTVDHLAARVAVSEQAAATAHVTLGGSYELLWNGIDVDGFRRAEPWPTDGPTIFFVGRHEPRKGLDVLVAAHEQLPPGTRLWIAGEGPQTASLQARTRGNASVEWLGTIGEGEKLRRLRGADVFCAPSIGGESFGVVLLEALAAATPVVASDLDGYRNVVRHGREGLLAPPGDVDALAAALRSALAGGPGIATLVEGGARRAEELSLARLARAYIVIYERIMGRTRRGAPRAQVTVAVADRGLPDAARGILYARRPDVRAPEVRVTAVDTPVAAVSPERRTAVVLALVTVPEAVVVGIVAGVIGGAGPGVIGFVVVLVVAAAVVWTRAADVAATLGGAAADPVRHARLLNVVDGLCVSAGVRTPSVVVVDTPGRNLATAGREAAAATLVVTSGLVDGLTRMELEGVIAAGLVGIRRGDTRPATVAAVTGIGVGRALPAQRDAVVDEAAAALTRYPPGLVAAYEKLLAGPGGTAVPGVATRSAHLWLADPDPTAPAAAYRTDLAQRIDALREL